MPKGPDIPANDLEAMVRERIGEGRLPVSVGGTLKAGFGSYSGSEAQCDVCGGRITMRNVKYEVSGVHERPLLFHLNCYSAWQKECIRRQGPKK